MAAPAVHQHQRLVGRQAAQRERPLHVGRVGDALVREVDGGCDRLENLARLRGPLPRQVGAGVHVHGHRQLLGGGVPRARPDHDVDRREPDRLGLEREVLVDRLPPGHRDLRRRLHVAEQPCAHGARAGRHARDRVGARRRRAGAEQGPVDRNLRVCQRGARFVGHAAAHSGALRRECGGREEHQDPAHTASFIHMQGDRQRALAPEIRRSPRAVKRR